MKSSHPQISEGADCLIGSVDKETEGCGPGFLKVHLPPREGSSIPS